MKKKSLIALAIGVSTLCVAGAATARMLLPDNAWYVTYYSDASKTEVVGTYNYYCTGSISEGETSPYWTNIQYCDCDNGCGPYIGP